MKIWIYLVVIVLAVSHLQAQNITCGANLTDLNAEEVAVVRNAFAQHRFINPRSNQRDSVPITVHIVTPNLNDPGITFEEIETEVERVNIVYAQAGIIFYICGSPRIIEGAATYAPAFGDILNTEQYVPNTLNVYFADAVAVNNDLVLCGYARFPYFGSVESRYIMMAKGCSTDGSTLAHEIGHFYGLFHTHETFQGAEFADGSNCNVAGDLLCDTPADPNLSIPGALQGCTYVGRFTDANGESYIPDASNIMSYAPSSCTRRLTPDQWAVVESVHLDQNQYLIGNCDFYPDFGVNSTTTDFEISSNQDLDITYSFSTRKLERDYEVGFKVFLFDDLVSRIGVLLHEETISLSEGQAGFDIDLNLDFPIVKTSGEYYLTAIVDPDFEIIERTEKNNTFISTVNVDNSQFESLSLFPNPVDNELSVFFRDRQIRGEFSIRIFRYDGVEVLRDQGNKSREEFFRNIDVSALNRGFYLAYINFDRLNFSHTFKFYKN